jgi:hypothetical protein
MMDWVITGLSTLNQLLSAGIAITAFSLLLYAFTFNLRDRVARTFTIILACVVIIFVGDSLASISTTSMELSLWLSFQWGGLIFLPISYLHFSDALLITTGRPSRGRRRLLIRLTYVLAFGFLVLLLAGKLVGPVVVTNEPAPYLQRTLFTWVFMGFYGVVMAWALVNFWRAYKRTVTSTSRRRMLYLLAGASAPALGSFPYLLLGPNLAAAHPILFWATATISNMFVSVLLVLMAYTVAFFGVSWPDRVVKRRLFKWLLRGPGTASLVLAIVTITRRIGEQFGQTYTAAVPVFMVGSILILEYMITVSAPVWERWLFHGGDASSVTMLQDLEERLLTSGDLRQFLEAILIAVCDRYQSDQAFIVSLGTEGEELLVTVGTQQGLPEDLSASLIQPSLHQNGGMEIFRWGDYRLVPLFSQRDEKELLGLLGFRSGTEQVLDDDQKQALMLLAQRASIAMDERIVQQHLFSSLELLTPEVEMIQRLRAAARYGGTQVLSAPEPPLTENEFSLWVKDALTHYWGGPKLTESPLLGLNIVKKALVEHEGNPSKALRAILRKAIEQTRPEGERRFTAEWMLYNILEMKFMEGHKVREIALRLAMSEADLYRKQRVAIESVARAILEMEEKAQHEKEEVAQISDGKDID